MLPQHLPRYNNGRSYEKGVVLGEMGVALITFQEYACKESLGLLKLNSSNSKLHEITLGLKAPYCVIDYLLRSMSSLVSPFSSVSWLFHITMFGKQQPTGHSERHCVGEQ